MTKLPTIEGCLTALVTPFRDGRVDFDALAKLVDWQIENGVDGIVSVGTTGESATLDVDEHVAVIAATVRAAKGRVPVVAGAGGNASRLKDERLPSAEQACIQQRRRHARRFAGARRRLQHDRRRGAQPCDDVAERVVDRQRS